MTTNLRSFLARHGVGRTFAALALLAGTVGGAGVVAGAETGAATSAEQYAELQHRYVWGGVGDARPVSPYMGIPREIVPAYPFSRSYLDSVPGRSEAFGAFVYGSEEGEEGIIDTMAGMGDNIWPLNPSLIRCNNPDVGRGTSARYNPFVGLGHSMSAGANIPRGVGSLAAGFAETATQSPEARKNLSEASAQVQKNFSPQAKTWGDNVTKAGQPATPPEGAPGATVDCTDRLGAHSRASSGAVQTAQFTLGSGIGITSTRFDAAARAVVSEARSVVHDVNAGAVRIPFLAGWVKLETPLGHEPKVSYQFDVVGLTVNGQPVGGQDQKGLHLAGRDLVPAAAMQQFQKQMEAYAEPLAALASWDLAISAPKIAKDGNEHSVSAPVLVLGGRPGPAAGVPDASPVQPPVNAGKDRIGDSFGIRLGYATATAHLTEAGQ